MSRQDATERAGDWFGPQGEAWTQADLSPMEKGRDITGCRVGARETWGRHVLGRGKTWEDAFKDARRRGYDPSQGWDWKTADSL